MLSNGDKRFRSLFESLEERVLFDGAPDAAFEIPQVEAVDAVPAQLQKSQFSQAQAQSPTQLIVIDLSLIHI